MSVRVRKARATDFRRRESGHAVVRRTKVGVLARQEQAWVKAAVDEGFGQRSELDNFRTRTGD